MTVLTKRVRYRIDFCKHQWYFTEPEFLKRDSETLKHQGVTVFEVTETLDENNQVIDSTDKLIPQEKL